MGRSSRAGDGRRLTRRPGTAAYDLADADAHTVSGFVWRPSPEDVERANVTRLARRLGCADYHELHRVSVEDPERFWPELVDDLGIEFSTPWGRVLDASAGPEWPKWFVGG